MENSGYLDEAEKIFKHAHNKAKECIPDISVNKIFDVLLDVALKKISVDEAANKIVGPYKEAVPEYIKCFINVAQNDLQNEVRSSIINCVNEYLGKSDFEAISKLADTDFSKKLEASSEKIILLSIDYMKGKIPTDKFIEKLGTSGINEPIHTFISAIVPDELKNINIEGMDLSKIVNEILTKIPHDKIITAAFSSMAIAGFSGAFIITSKYLKEDWLSYENRLKVQKENEEIVQEIRSYRLKLNEFVNTYVSEHIDKYQNGFLAMDKAIVEHDTDGFISANADIQSALGYKAQFTNQDEFDDLMKSFTTIKL